VRVRRNRRGREDHCGETTASGPESDDAGVAGCRFRRRLSPPPRRDGHVRWRWWPCRRRAGSAGRRIAENASARQKTIATAPRRRWRPPRASEFSANTCRTHTRTPIATPETPSRRLYRNSTQHYPPFHPHTPTSHRQPVAETVGRPETIIVRFRWYYYYYINECGVHRRVEIDIEAPRVVKFPNTSIYVNRHSPIHCYHNSGLSREWVAVGSSAPHRQAPAQWVI